VGDSQSQKAGDGSTLIQVGGNVSIGLSYTDVKQILTEERERIVGQIWERAQEMLREAGVQPGPVPIKTLVPLLQYASLAEDEYLQNQWAALLANCSVGEHAGERVATLVEILRQLSAREAHFLKAIVEHGAEVRTHSPAYSVLAGFAAETLAAIYSGPEAFGDNDYHFVVDNLLRLGLLAVRTRPVNDEESGPFGPHETYSLTILGSEFIDACERPKKAESQ
jgi:hypothetical protein